MTTGPAGHSDTAPARDISANRQASKWTRKELVLRLFWDLAAPLFFLSPRQLWVWRRVLLRAFGAKIGANVHICPGVKITIPWNLSIGDETSVGDGAILYALGPISIGRQATISQYAHLCAGSHDYTRPDMPLTKPPIVIGDGVWVCADAFVGPDRTVGDGAVIAARAVVIKDVEAGMIVGGNPALPVARVEAS